MYELEQFFKFQITCVYKINLLSFKGGTKMYNHVLSHNIFPDILSQQVASNWAV